MEIKELAHNIFLCVYTLRKNAILRIFNRVSPLILSDSHRPIISQWPMASFASDVMGKIALLGIRAGTASLTDIFCYQVVVSEHTVVDWMFALSL